MNQENINRFLYSIYNDVSPSAVSIECRKKYGLYDDNCLVYGESHLPSLYDIFNEVAPKTGEIFYDWGSGSGRVVLYAALNFPFAKCKGIELLDDLVDVAQTKLELFKKELPNLSDFDPNKSGEIEFIQADFTKVAVSDADVIYMASTCFDEKLMSSLAALLEKQLRSGARVITATKSLPSEQFKITKSQLFPMEWGQVTVFFHEKI
ncbi:MAG: hypothetical protein ACD_21C00293G0013 [uncultured bacterium]|nr:MAG: hypothetical protein ACD_21C00293G0013 [uncultured bacterium]